MAEETKVPKVHEDADGAYVQQVDRVMEKINAE
jgi:hypothetical protein